MPRGIGVLASHCIAAEDQQSHCQGRGFRQNWAKIVALSAVKPTQMKGLEVPPLCVSYIGSEKSQQHTCRRNISFQNGLEILVEFSGNHPSKFWNGPERSRIFEHSKVIVCQLGGFGWF